MTTKHLTTRKELESAGISQRDLRNLMVTLAKNANLVPAVLKKCTKVIESKGWKWLINQSGGVKRNTNTNTGVVTDYVEMTFLGGRTGQRMLPAKGCVVM